MFKKILETTGLKLNAIDWVNPGESGASPTGGQRFPGLAGSIFSFNQADALKFSKTSIGTLYGGWYQIVKTKAASSTAPARGRVAYWDDRDLAQVTPDVPTPNSRIAGIYISALTKGQWGIIQIGGLASCLCRAAVTDTTTGNIVIAHTDGTVDGIAGATAVTGTILSVFLGVADEALANNGVKKVYLTRLLVQGYS